MLDLPERIAEIEERNVRVTYDKAWETSKTRRFLISLVTYVCGVVLLTVLGHDGAWKHAFVPVMGYLVSTFSLPPIKKIWVRQRVRRGMKNVTVH